MALQQISSRPIDLHEVREGILEVLRKHDGAMQPDAIAEALSELSEDYRQAFELHVKYCVLPGNIISNPSAFISFLFRYTGEVDHRPGEDGGFILNDLVRQEYNRLVMPDIGRIAISER